MMRQSEGTTGGGRDPFTYFYRDWDFSIEEHHIELPLPKKIIYNYPATIIIWSDNTKTIVKVSKDDTYSREVGIMRAYMKKIFGSSKNYQRIIDRTEQEESGRTPNNISENKCLSGDGAAPMHGMFTPNG